ncbi:MAG: polysaccharide export outer membrane protein [Parvibaculaceae bacterium]|jgi:polysaccharide export outer membrane protein
MAIAKLFGSELSMSGISKFIRAVLLKRVVALVGLLVLTACTGNAIPSLKGPTAGTTEVLEYRLGSGDKLRVIVFGEEALSGEFDVDGTGTVSLPLIGLIQAKDLTLREFEAEVSDKLRDGYLKDPRVSAEVLNYRPFYIFGEVEEPGEYPYTNGMTALNAVAVGGGYTFRADKLRIYISRDQENEVEYLLNTSVRIQPGDIVRIAERFF